MQWAAVTTFVGVTRVPPQNWSCEASVICIMNGYADVVVVVPPTTGWGAALAAGAVISAVAAAAAVAARTAAAFLARVNRDMVLLGGLPVGGRAGWGVEHEVRRTGPVCPASGTDLRYEHRRTPPMREAPTGVGQGKPSVPGRTRPRPTEAGPADGGRWPETGARRGSGGRAAENPPDGGRWPETGARRRKGHCPAGARHGTGHPPRHRAPPAQGTPRRASRGTAQLTPGAHAVLPGPRPRASPRPEGADSALRAARRRLLRAPPRRQADDVDAGADAEFAVDAGEGRLDRLDA